MIHARMLAIAALGFVLSSQPVASQSPFQYRDYTLGSTVASVVTLSGTRQDEMKTLHERPATIQEVRWRAPYVSAGSKMADPVRDVVFSFYDDQLYEIAVTYDRDRMEGLTNDDVIEALSATYGVPLLRHGRSAHSAQAAKASTDTVVVAQWEDAASLLTLTRMTYAPHFQLALISKTLHPRARAAIDAAVRLDIKEAPQRELDKQEQETADALVASQKARIVNKAAFKP